MATKYSLDELYTKLEKAGKAGDAEAVALFKEDIAEAEALEQAGEAPPEAPEAVPGMNLPDDQNPALQAMQESLQTPTVPDMVPESDFANQVMQSLTFPFPDKVKRGVAAAQREVAGGLRGTRQLFNEYIQKDPEELAQLQQDEANARVRDKELLESTEGGIGSSVASGMEWLAPAGLLTKANKLKAIRPAYQAANQFLTGAALQGLFTPTVEGESRTGDMVRSGLTNAVGPLFGPAMGAAARIPVVGRVAEGAGKIFSRDPSKLLEQIEDEAGKKIGELSKKFVVPVETLARHLKRDLELPLARYRQVAHIQQLARRNPRQLVRGEDVQKMRARAGAGMRAAQGSSRPNVAMSGSALGDFIGQLDNAVIEAAPPKLAKALRKYATQYRTGERGMSIPEVIREGFPASFLQTLTEYIGGGKEPPPPKKDKEKRNAP